MNVAAVRTQGRIGFRAARSALAGLLLAALLGSVAGVRPARADEATAAGVLPAFNRICVELTAGREGLRSGHLSDESFVDLVLDLFVRADSLSNLLEATLPGTHAYTPAASLARGLRCLKNSLRENYEGVVGRDGYRFVTADLDFKAAVAWRSGATEVASRAP
jgi:hypothetical protein